MVAGEIRVQSYWCAKSLVSWPIRLSGGELCHDSAFKSGSEDRDVS